MRFLNREDIRWKGLDYYVSLKKKWNKDLYGIHWQRKYQHKPSIGAMVHLCNEWEPESYEHFYELYLRDGIKTFGEDIDPKYRGRTPNEIEDIAIRWRDDTGDFDTPLSEYFDAIILHTIVETYVGIDFEKRAIECLENNGYQIVHGTDEEDSAMNIDFKVYKDGKLMFFIQVKPISFIVSDRIHTFKDRMNVFEKHVKGNERYPGVPYFYLIYDPYTNMWVYNEQQQRSLFRYDELVKRDGSPVRSKYMMKKYETEHLERN